MEVLRVWRADDRAREEHEGGPQDGAYGVRDGELWWSWDERNGATSNQDDPKVGSGVGEALGFMLDPTPLLGSLTFAVVGRGRVAGRQTVTAAAVPRRRDPRRHPPSFELYELGGGADCYRLEVDAQRGVLLEVVALHDGELFRKSPPSRSRSTARFRRSDSRSSRPPVKRSSPPGDGRRGESGSRRPAPRAVHGFDSRSDPERLARDLPVQGGVRATALAGQCRTHLPLRRRA